MTAAPLPKVASDVLESLHAHRLLTARQLRQLHAPHAGSRWTEKVMARLLANEMVGFVHAGGGARRIYFLTANGYHALQPAHPSGLRGATQDMRHAASVLSAHTLAINDVGLAFVAAARRRGDEFGPLAWRHEIAHPIGTSPGRRTELVIADAVLTYMQHNEDGALHFHYRFLELDRATQPTAALAAKLSRYARLATYTTKNSKEPSWHQNYPVLPEVMVVLTNAPADALKRRAQTVLALCQADALLRRTPQVAISITTLDDLLAQGPWAPVFRRLNTKGPVTWTGGPA
jgi:Replication-relaxation